MFQIWPAIDLRGGKCVRLKQGDYQQETVFAEDPVAMARHWAELGAKCLHLVDLDAARDGQLTNLPVIKAIVEELSLPCQLGGGVRNEETIQRLLDIGLTRLVVGTRALREPEWFREMSHRFPNQLALGIDARDGKVATDGWLKVSEVSATSLARQFDDEPVSAIIYTDIARDGMMSGPNFASIEEMKRTVTLPVIASGGVTTASDVAELARRGVPGCIIGRSLYEGTLTLAAAFEAAAIAAGKGGSA
ncbi:MAG TPA: 1-(5-phosphoribosyl)-5-[(5-phosphoribosylamino)methylideneamino]imidazole-4-carboxamide isomerase [Pirellulaceae bacterium]|nr:1-(5-phosphoribosyl)-5-[(5-phosphoribosylamino)methylideneamino]imidazole-4-carboxamide isomerase [Pirellulaceae bacterium]